MPDIRLVDLPVICRYSLAVRQELAPAEEVLAVLDASREAVLAAMGAAGPASSRPPAKKEVAAATRPKARSAAAPGATPSRSSRASTEAAPTPVSARLTPRPPGSRNPVRALAALPRKEAAGPQRRRGR